MVDIFGVIVYIISRNHHLRIGSKTMLTQYFEAAMKNAQYKILPDDEGCFGKIPGLQGVWVNVETLESCREELKEVLEEWIIIGLKTGTTLPEITKEEWESL